MDNNRLNWDGLGRSSFNPQNLTTCFGLSVGVAMHSPPVNRSVRHHEIKCSKPMRRYTAILLLLITMSILGCQPNPRSAEELSPQVLRSKCNTDTTDHVVYIGSDEHYHYFRHDTLGKDTYYKVRSDLMALRTTFELGSSEPYVFIPGLHEVQSSQ